MTIALSIVVILVVFSLLALIHEWGHFITARIFGVKVEEFSVFMGPKLFQWKSKKTGTKYSLRLLPIGGYCAMKGETEDGVNEPDSFGAKPWWQRAIILVAGAFMNTVLALLIIVILFCINGYDTTKVASVSDYQPMVLINLEEGDRVTKFNGRSLITPTDYSLYNYVGEEANVTFTIKKKDRSIHTYLFEREVTVNANNGEDKSENPGTIKSTAKVYEVINGENVYVGTWDAFWDNNRTLTISFITEENTNTLVYKSTDEEGNPDEEGQYMLYVFNAGSLFKKFGFSFTYSEHGNILQVIENAFLYLISLVKSVYLSLWWLITGQLGLSALSGPIGMTTIVNQVVSTEGVSSALKFMTIVDLTALISANLAVANLLPIPGLDGGKIFFILIELIRKGKKIPAKVENIITVVFFALLILLAVVVAGSDIVKIVQS